MCVYYIIFYQRIFIIFLLAWLHSWKTFAVPFTCCPLICCRLCFPFLSRVVHHSLIISCWNAATQDKINEQFYSIIRFSRSLCAIWKKKKTWCALWYWQSVCKTAAYPSYINWLDCGSIRSVIVFSILYSNFIMNLYWLANGLMLFDMLFLLRSFA